jgi:hypothetical protein
MFEGVNLVFNAVKPGLEVVQLYAAGFKVGCCLLLCDIGNGLCLEGCLLYTSDAADD